MSRGRGGGVLVGTLGPAALVGLAGVGFPLHTLATCALVLVIVALCVAVLLGAKPAAGAFLKWAVALCVVATTWPAVSARVRGGLVAAFPDGLRLRGVRPASASLDGLLYDVTTVLLVALLLLLAAFVLIVSSRIRAGLRPPVAPPRPQARRRARLVDPQREPRGQELGEESAQDDFGLLGGADGR